MIGRSSGGGERRVCDGGSWIFRWWFEVRRWCDRRNLGFRVVALHRRKSEAERSSPVDGGGEWCA